MSGWAGPTVAAGGASPLNHSWALLLWTLLARLGTARATRRSQCTKGGWHIRIAQRRAEEEGGDTLFVPEGRRSRRLRSAIRAGDVRAADLQEEPTKRIRDGDGSARRSFRRIRRRRRLPERISQRAQRAIRRSERSNQTLSAARCRLGLAPARYGVRVKVSRFNA